MVRHLPYLWRFRIAVKAGFGYHVQVWRVWDAWERAEGGTASFNPWNTTQPWPRATIYNKVGVRNYATGADGIAATVVTLKNGHYPTMCHLYRSPGKLTAAQIVETCRAEFHTWGTNPDTILRVLGV